jgi:hypothetical protein
MLNMMLSSIDTVCAMAEWTDTAERLGIAAAIVGTIGLIAAAITGAWPLALASAATVFAGGYAPVALDWLKDRFARQAEPMREALAMDDATFDAQIDRLEVALGVMPPEPIRLHQDRLTAERQEQASQQRML